MLFIYQQRQLNKTIFNLLSIKILQYVEIHKSIINEELKNYFKKE